jgi:hypothetical protein
VFCLVASGWSASSWSARSPDGRSDYIWCAWPPPANSAGRGSSGFRQALRHETLFSPRGPKIPPEVGSKAKSAAHAINDSLSRITVPLAGGRCWARRSQNFEHACLVRDDSPTCRTQRCMPSQIAANAISTPATIRFTPIAVIMTAPLVWSPKTDRETIYRVGATINLNGRSFGGVGVQILAIGGKSQPQSAANPMSLHHIVFDASRCCSPDQEDTTRGLGASEGAIRSRPNVANADAHHIPSRPGRMCTFSFVPGPHCATRTCATPP